jgi:hypothetical protein
MTVNDTSASNNTGYDAIASTKQEPLSFKEGLLKARSHIVFILGLITAFGIVMKLESWKSDEEIARLQAASGNANNGGTPAVITNYADGGFDFKKSEGIPVATHGALTEQEMQWARTAWKYFENNTDPKTGLVNSVDKYNSTTMWDMGSYLLALISAQRLGIINQSEFDTRLKKTLSTLSTLGLFENGVPNKAYNTTSSQMTDYTNQPSQAGIGWSALDLGRMLVPLNIIVWHYPDHAKSVKQVLSRWDLSKVVHDGKLHGAGVSSGKTNNWQEGRLGYEEYSSKPFSAIGLDVSNAMQYDSHVSTIDIYGVEIPFDSRTPDKFKAQNYVLSEPYILGELEYGNDETAKEIAYRVYRAQEERFKKEGILTAVTEDHVDQKPYFVYNTVYSGGQPWRCLSPSGEDFPDLRSVSTKAAFGWHAMYNTDYTRKLTDKVQSLNDPARGWYAGVYEKSGQANKAITCNTNGVVLEALAYKKFGPAFSFKAQ